MSITSFSRWGAIGVAAVALVASMPREARAGLGDLEAAVPADAKRLGGSVKTTERALYRVHEIQLTSGTVVREFAGADGRIFAVAWSGPTIPDLRQTLGRYFDAFVSAAQDHHLGRTHMEIRQNDWVMQSSGHMRAFRGRAYLPQAIPPGTSLDELH